MNTIKARLKKIAANYGLSIRAFEEKCGLNRGNISNMSDDGSVGSDKLSKIIDRFPGINPHWLITGSGEMIKQSVSQTTTLAPSAPVSANKDTKNKSVAQILSAQSFVDDTDTNLPEKSFTDGVPFYDAETTGGVNGLVASSTTDAPLIGYLNIGTLFCGHPDAAIRHAGDSMVEYPDGCILVVQQIHAPRLLVPGRNYVFETDEYRFTKRYAPAAAPDAITLHSTNRELYPDGTLVYPPFQVPCSDIRRVFAILGYVVSQSCQIRYIQ